MRRLTRVYTAQDLNNDDLVELEGQAGHYLTRVLRLAVGDAVTLFNGNGYDYAGVVEDIHRQKVRVGSLDQKDPSTESALRITLVQAISRGERMDYSVQKATELGVFAIQPVISERVEVRLDAKRQQKRLSHWRGVVTSACEQCGRAKLPDVLEPVSLGEWLAKSDNRQRLILDPDAAVKLSDCRINGDAVSVLVGPEGGFSRQELDQAAGMGVAAVALGPRVLRTESAGPAAIAVLQVIAGDF